MLQPIENLLAKYFAGEANPMEKERVDIWRKAHPELFRQYEKTYHADIFDRRNFLPSTTINVLNRKYSMALLFKVAAVFTGLLMLATVMYFYSRTLQVRFENTTASVEHVLLPDGSEVMLDKAAVLTYQKTIFGKFDRKVSLSGRAYFHIFRDTKHPFTVHAGSVDVKVLGTRFSVNRRAARTQVVLSHGKVLVSVKREPRGVILQNPGDQVVVVKNGPVRKNRVKASLYNSWMDKKIYFNECTVKEVINMLDDSYGLKVNIRNPKLLNKKLFGSAPSDDPYLIREALFQILHLENRKR